MESDFPSPAAPVDGAHASRGEKALLLVLLIAVALVGGLLLAYRPATPPAGPHGAPEGAGWTPAPQPEGDTVTLTIDFGNGARRMWTLPWSAGVTVENLMQRTRDFRPGIAFEQSGSGKMAFLTSLEGVSNGTDAGRYWQYSIDGRRGEVSFGAQPLEAGAVVLWEFRREE